MSNENGAGVVDDPVENPEEQETDARSYTGWCLLAVAVVILALGTQQVLSANAEREDQLRKIHDAQERMT